LDLYVNRTRVGAVPVRKGAPTRAEFERLKAEHERSIRDMEAMRETARQIERLIHHLPK